MVSDPACLRLGLDLGSAAIKVAFRGPPAEAWHLACAPSGGSPLSALLHVLEEIPESIGHSDFLRVAVTGSGQSLLKDLIPIHFVNEAIALAVAARAEFPCVRTIIDLGGQLSKWILLGDDDHGQTTVIDFATNGLCAAGAGGFLEQQAGRLGLSLKALGSMAAAASRGATIAGRCSVFAKSDMIHLQQKGTPLDEIALGLCHAMARTFLSTVIQGRRVEPPLLLLGGGATNPGLVRAFRKALELDTEELLVPAEPLFFAACGAASMTGQVPATTMEQLLEELRKRRTVCIAGTDSSTANLLPLKTTPNSQELRPEENPAPVHDGHVEAYLGVDVGSVSTNLVLLGLDLRVLQGIYLPTAGRPVEALEEGLKRVRERYQARLQILGVGSTGSGRHLAAKLLGADVTYNEITAQMVSTLRFVPEADTIFEIGGQDSKYIHIRDGRLADFEMNKICAGGTGSFLEEQGQRLGVRIIDEFAELALAATKPCDLGTRCTVFMDTELVQAQERGVAVRDLCAGLAYSIARNYPDRVVAGRPIGNHIVFQGGTASNVAVVAAFRQLLGRPIQAHPYNRISGAIGAALLAARARPRRSRFLGLQSCVGSELKSFECRCCENRCQVNRVRVGARVVHFGDICERYSEGDHTPVDSRRAFPDLFAARERLMEKYLPVLSQDGDAGARMGLLRASLNFEFLPFWTVFLTELGYVPVLSGKTNSAQMHEYARGAPAEACLPIKAAVAHARSLLAGGEIDRIFLPMLLECPAREKDDASHTCFYSQQLGDMLRVELKSRIISAQFALTQGLLGLTEPVLTLADALNRSVEEVLRAFTKARAHQALFSDEQKRLGSEALRRNFDRAVVVLGRPYNTHDPYLNLALARRLEQSGLCAIPWDLLPLDEVHLASRWQTVPWHYAREHLRAAECIRRDPRLYPLMISSYGCGPDAFIAMHVEELLADRPRLLLEFDEHRGEAGLVTRLEAFADEIEKHMHRRDPRLAVACPTPGHRSIPLGKRFFIPNFSEHAAIYAAVLQAAGRPAQVLPPPDESTVRLGEAHTSGRECHPFAIIAGEIERLLHSASTQSGDVFLLPNCASPCLIQQYGDAIRILLEREKLPKIEIWEAATTQLGSLIGTQGLLRLYEGLLVTDILLVLSTRLRPYQAQAGEMDRVTAACLARVAQAIARRERLDRILAEAASQLWAMPRTGRLGDRPVVGITGDLYTRMNPIGNANLFHRLEEMGCEVWPSPFFATAADLSATLNFGRDAGRGRFRAAATEGLARALTSAIRRRVERDLPDPIRSIAVEPSSEELVRLARPYVGPGTNYLILLTVAKMADFIKRGAAGAINAVALNCMVGTVVSSVIPAIRADQHDAPMITLFYGGTEGPSQRIHLETFVHQAKQKHKAPQ